MSLGRKFNELKFTLIDVNISKEDFSDVSRYYIYKNINFFFFCKIV